MKRTETLVRKDMVVWMERRKIQKGKKIGRNKREDKGIKPRQTLFF